MYKSALIMIATAAVAVTASAHARSATEFGTIEEAKAMLKRAVVAVQQDKIAAINKFNYNDQQFRDRDLFVFCFNGKNGKYTAHEAMVGHDVRAFRDAKGQPVGQHMYEIAAEGKTVSVDYMSPVPGSAELALKRAYLTRVGDQVCGVSAYQFRLTPKFKHRSQREGCDGDIFYVPDAIVANRAASAVCQSTEAMEERVGMRARVAKDGRRCEPVNSIRCVGARSVWDNGRPSPQAGLLCQRSRMQ